MGGFQNLAIFWVLLHIIQYRVGGKAVFFCVGSVGKDGAFRCSKEEVGSALCNLRCKSAPEFGSGESLKNICNIRKNRL